PDGRRRVLEPHVLEPQLLALALQELVDGAVRRAVEQHLDGLARHGDLVDLADDGDRLAEDRHLDAARLLDAAARLAVRADDAGADALQVLRLLAHELGEVEHVQVRVVLVEAEGVLGAEAAADGAHGVARLEHEDGLERLLVIDLHLARLGVDAQTAAAAALQFLLDLAFRPDERADAVLRDLHQVNDHLTRPRNRLRPRLRPRARGRWAAAAARGARWP